MKPDASTRKRTIAKAVSWETFSTLATFGVAWLMFGSLGTCIAFAATTFLMKLVLFYGHDRLWHQIAWGKSVEQRCIEASDMLDELRTEMRKQGVIAIFNGRRVVGFPAIVGYERIARLSGIKSPTVTYAHDRYGRTGILAAGQRFELSCDSNHPTIIDACDTNVA